jgi:hypothetical protein
MGFFSWTNIQPLWRFIDKKSFIFLIYIFQMILALLGIIFQSICISLLANLITKEKIKLRISILFALVGCSINLLINIEVFSFFRFLNLKQMIIVGTFPISCLIAGFCATVYLQKKLDQKIKIIWFNLSFFMLNIILYLLNIGKNLIN